MDLNKRENSNSDKIMKNIYFNKYKPVKKIGEGSFGMIYKAENIQTGEVYALKFEDRHAGQNLLETEAYVMGYLKGGKLLFKILAGIPSVKSYGYSGDYNILVMELLGKSLDDIVNLMPEKKFSVKTVCMLAVQMLTILEQIHSKHIVHRDIKPDNFVMGFGENEKSLYLLDFGLARKYRSSTNFQHYPMRNRKKLTGTARYASINALKGTEQSRRDDLEAVGYVLMYFLRGSLPWQGLPVKAKEDRYKKIMEKKLATTPEELCQGFPSEFVEYIHYTRDLSYEEDPDYSHLKSLFTNLMTKNNLTNDFLYDWISPSKNAQITVINNNNNNTNNNITNNSILNNYTNQLNNKDNKISVVNEENNNVAKTIIIQENRTNSVVPRKNNFVVDNLNSQITEVKDVNNTINNTIPNNLNFNTVPGMNMNISAINYKTVNTVQAQRNDDSNVQQNLKTTPNIIAQSTNFNSHLNKSSIKVDINTSSIIPPKKSKAENKCCIL